MLTQTKDTACIQPPFAVELEDLRDDLMDGLGAALRQLIFCNRIVLEDARNAWLNRSIRVVVAVCV